ncbi:MAG TPA: septal ring lytic transglycosylase RlpA family protein [Polyangia bacterium]|nr:septal ring lytic transglycosylase RlpA family protein [Polyangia bacterium]
MPQPPRRDRDPGLLGLVVLVSSLSAACATTRSNAPSHPRVSARTADRTTDRTTDRTGDRGEAAAPSRHGAPAADVMIGLASWYGREHQGGPTASGERFNMRDLTAAHRRLPFGTRVRVTNLRNSKSVTVRINDRGPYGRGRIIDLSWAAARAIDMIEAGVVRVRIEVLAGTPGS